MEAGSPHNLNAAHQRESLGECFAQSLDRPRLHVPRVRTVTVIWAVRFLDAFEDELLGDECFDAWVFFEAFLNILPDVVNK